MTVMTWPNWASPLLWTAGTLAVSWILGHAVGLVLRARLPRWLPAREEHVVHGAARPSAGACRGGRRSSACGCRPATDARSSAGPRMIRIPGSSEPAKARGRRWYQPMHMPQGRASLAGSCSSDH